MGGCACLWSPRTSSSPGEASSAGPPARCSLRSRAASSPTGLGCVRPCVRSYSTHRLLSASPAAGDPVRAQASAGEPVAGGVVQVRFPPPPLAASNTRAQPGTLAIGPRVPPAGWSATSPRPPPSRAPPPPCHPGTHTWGSPPQAGDMHVQTLGFPGGEGARRHGHRDSTLSLTQTRGSKQWSWHRHLHSHGEVRGSCRPFPWGGREHRASWVLGTHRFLSSTEELGHVPNDVAKTVIHLDVGAHPGRQLGSGVRLGEPGRGRLSAPSSTCHPTPQPGPDPAAPREGPVPGGCREAAGQRSCASWGEPHLWSQRKMAP